MLTYKNMMKDDPDLMKILGVERGGDPRWPLPNSKRVDESTFWGYRASQGFKSEAWISLQQIEDKDGRKRWANVLIYFLDKGTYIAGGFVVVVFYSEYKGKHPDGQYLHDIEYYSWMACDHDFKEKNIGRCLHRYTCTKCKAHYDVDSSG